MAKATLLAGVLIDSFSHFLIEIALGLLKLGQLIFLKLIPCPLIEVSLLLIFGEFMWCNLAF